MGRRRTALRDLLHRYTAMRFQDLFPQGSAKPVLENPRTITLFEELEDRLAAMEARSANQCWDLVLISQLGARQFPFAQRS
jgi:hypothetical protein